MKKEKKNLPATGCRRAAPEFKIQPFRGSTFVYTFVRGKTYAGVLPECHTLWSREVEVVHGDSERAIVNAGNRATTANDGESSSTRRPDPAEHATKQRANRVDPAVVNDTRKRRRHARPRGVLIMYSPHLAGVR